MQKKYELTEETMKYCGHILHRIKSLKDMPEIGIKKGQLGGWIENEKNLSHEENCWIFHEAKVYENGRVSGNGEVYGNGVVRYNFSLGVCLNIITDPYNISYSGVNEKGEHFISVGCQCHRIEDWENLEFRNKIIRSYNFPEKNVEKLLYILGLYKLEYPTVVPEKKSITLELTDEQLKKLKTILEI